jgi:hypothetical protein
VPRKANFFTPPITTPEIQHSSSMSIVPAPASLFSGYPTPPSKRHSYQTLHRVGPAQGVDLGIMCYSQAEEDRQSEKLHLTLKVWRKGAGLSPAPHCGESGGLRSGGRGLMLKGLSTALNRADGARLIGEHQAQKASQELLPRRPILSCLK